MKAAVRAACVAALAALALFVGVSTANAGTVPWFGGCYQSGTATTTAGAVQVRFGWATNSPARTQKFLDYQQVTYTVNGGTPVQTSAGWGPITQGTNGAGETIYLSTWTSPVLANLASGESVSVSFSLKTTKTVWDDDKTFFRAGTELLAPVRTCTITAT